MSKIQNILALIANEWSEPKTAIHRGEEIPFELSCTINNPSNSITHNFKFPDHLLDFYQIADGSSLFKDEKYGQWGLNILNISDSFRRTDDFKLERKSDFEVGDLIIGEFIGDSDLLLIRCDSSNSDFGKIMAVNPIDPREDWSVIADNFEKFLVEYYQSQGDKFWE